MTELGLILFGALLVNNFVLAQFLGLCPFMGITPSFDTALATGLATTFVLALAAVTSHTLYHFLLVPLQLAYLNRTATIGKLCSYCAITTNGNAGGILWDSDCRDKRLTTSGDQLTLG